jgi:hypothetical protein
MSLQGHRQSASRQNIRKGVGFQPAAWPIQRVHRAAPLVPSARLATTDLPAKCIASGRISEGLGFHALHSKEAQALDFLDMHKEIDGLNVLRQ